ncbi:helix-turn-helix domain-containing protein [Streptomyces sp. NPDC056411]|uniref:helix-turn-helix domain-containing protein n=1 Tax=Streptomyces sp. NPDC056411 TaxID=3345813 RepID=UPI0035D77B1F
MLIIGRPLPSPPLPGRLVAVWIRGRRLAAACRDLVDPSLHSTPIHAIATRWGFPRAGDFSRAFRTAYGTSPTTEAKHGLAGS